MSIVTGPSHDPGLSHDPPTGPTAAPGTDQGPVLVVVGADGSSAAVRHAVAEAERRRSALHVMHVVALGAEADHVLDRVLHEVHDLAVTRTEVTSTQHHGAVREAIAATSPDTQLVVVERRLDSRGGLGPLAGWVSSSPTAVVCVPQDWNAARRCGTVTVGVLDTLTCGPLLDVALEESASRAAQLRVVHVAVDEDEGPSADELAATLAQPQRLPFDGEVLVSMATGRPGVVLVAASATSDLVVIGRHHARHPVGSQLGGVARRVLRDAVCPVLMPTPSHSVSSAAWVFAGHLE